MDKEDALIVFENHVRELCKEHEEEKVSEQVQEHHDQRKNRDNMLVSRRRVPRMGSRVPGTPPPPPFRSKCRILLHFFKILPGETPRTPLEGHRRTRLDRKESRPVAATVQDGIFKFIVNCERSRVARSGLSMCQNLLERFVVVLRILFSECCTRIACFFP